VQDAERLLQAGVEAHATHQEIRPDLGAFDADVTRERVGFEPGRVRNNESP